MIKIDGNYKIVNDLLSKNSGEGVLPEEYTRIANLSQKDYFKLVLGSKNRTVNGQSRVVYGRNQILDARLRPFRKKERLAIVDGEVELPDNCAHIRAVLTDDLTALKVIDDNRVGKIMKDPLAKPNEDDIYYYEGDTFISVFTATPLTHVTIEYLKYPTDVNYAFTNTGVRGRPVFDPVNSVDFEWNETEEVELTTRILQQFGVEFRDGHIQNYTNITKSQE